MTEELRKLRKRRQREFEREGRSPEYGRLKKLFTETKKKEISKRREKILNELKDKTNKLSVYKILKKLGTGDDDDEHYMINEVDDRKVSPEEAANIVASHFASLSN